MEQSATARAFNTRLSFWTSQGLSGAAVYEQLAHDDELPPFFDPDDIAAIEGVLPSAVKKARNRGTGPAFLRMSGKIVKYPRADYCRHLAAKYVRRAA
jgi:hypothetical protein